MPTTTSFVGPPCGCGSPCARAQAKVVDSTRMPASLAPRHCTSFGHFKAASPTPRPHSTSTTATPMARLMPARPAPEEPGAPHEAGTGSARERHSPRPRGETQVRPRRPRPALCTSARQTRLRPALSCRVVAVASRIRCAFVESISKCTSIAPASIPESLRNPFAMHAESSHSTPPGQYSDPDRSPLTPAPNAATSRTMPSSSSTDTHKVLARCAGERCRALPLKSRNSDWRRSVERLTSPLPAAHRNRTQHRAHPWPENRPLCAVPAHARAHCRQRGS